MTRSGGYLALLAVSLTILALALVSTSPDFVPSSLSTAPALESAVRIEVALSWPDLADSADFSGSGWTRSCTPLPPPSPGADSPGYRLVIATAGHVLDVDEMESAVHPGHRAIVKVVIAYRDGRTFTAGREDLRVDRNRDYGEVSLPSPVSRQVLPTGDPLAVIPGARLVAVASPGALPFGVFDGIVILQGTLPFEGCPGDGWLTSIPVAPGASGGPVMDEQGTVVAIIVGFVEWPGGIRVSVVIPLPRPASEAAPGPKL